PGTGQRQTFRVGCGGSREKSFRSLPSIAPISAARCGGSRSPACSCVPATAARFTKTARTRPDHRRAGCTNTTTKLRRGNFGYGAADCPLCLNHFEVLPEKGPAHAEDNRPLDR